MDADRRPEARRRRLDEEPLAAREQPAGTAEAGAATEASVPLVEAHRRRQPYVDAVDRADEAERELAVLARGDREALERLVSRSALVVVDEHVAAGLPLLALEDERRGRVAHFWRHLTLCACAGTASAPSRSTVTTAEPRVRAGLMPVASFARLALKRQCPVEQPLDVLVGDAGRPNRSRPGGSGPGARPPRWCSARPGSRRSTRPARSPAYSSIAPSFQWAVPNTARPSKVSTGSSSSGRSRSSGRYSFAFSSQPVAHTSSKASASRRRRAPAPSEMQWAIPSTQWNCPGGVPREGNPNRLITPSTSRKRMGRWVVASGTFARLGARTLARGLFQGRTSIRADSA